METFSVLLALCVGNSPVTSQFPLQRPVIRSFDGFFDVCRNKRSSKQSWGWWFETPSCPLWRHCNVEDSIAVSDLRWNTDHSFIGLVQDCSNYSANALELLQSSAKPSIWSQSRHFIAVSHSWAMGYIGKCWSANALELLQSCTEPSIWSHSRHFIAVSHKWAMGLYWSILENTLHVSVGVLEILFMMTSVRVGCCEVGRSLFGVRQCVCQLQAAHRTTAVNRATRPGITTAAWIGVQNGINFAIAVGLIKQPMLVIK